MEEKKKQKISFKTIILIFFIIILLALSTYLITYILNLKKSKTVNIDYQALFNLQTSNKLTISPSIVEYNLENYSLEYYANKYSEYFEYTEKIAEENLELETHKILRSDYLMDDGENKYIDSYYFIELKNLIIVINTTYANEEIYEKYLETMNYFAKTIEIPENNSSTYNNAFTNILSNYNIPNLEELKMYKDIANQDSILVRAYENLTDEQKEKYDILYENVLVKNEKYIPEEYLNDEGFIYDPNYDIALTALNFDLISLGYENYNVKLEFIWDEETEKVFFYAEYSEELFYIYENDMKYNSQLLNSYNVTKDELQIIKTKSETILNNMPKGLSTYGKYKYLADSVCEITEYAYEELEVETQTSEYNERIHSLIGVFVDGRAVCDGNAMAYYYLCQKAGLFCELIEGRSYDLSEGHEFNYIKLGDKYYFVDITGLAGFGDFYSFAFVYDSNIENSNNQYIEYWLDTEEMADMPENSRFNNLMQNLGTINWSEIKQIY